MKFGALTGCHQKYERSFHFFGCQFFVCARCTGIALGQLLALLSLPYYKDISPSLLFLWAVLSLTALAVDGFGQLWGYWESTNFRRFVTGIFSGFCFTAFFVSLMIKIFFGR